jgi:ribonuclease P protein component
MAEKSFLQDVQKVEKDYLYLDLGFHISAIKHFTRLRTTKEFNGVYKHSTKTRHTPYFVLFYKKGPEYKVGFVASKKIGNAVHRNRAKRLLRAHFIENIDLLASGSYVLVAKPDLLSNSFLGTQKSYLQALQKCTALI